MAAQLKKDLGIDALMVVGRSGEFTVWLDEKLIAEKEFSGFPDPDDVVDAVRDASSP